MKRSEARILLSLYGIMPFLIPPAIQGLAGDAAGLLIILIPPLVMAPLIFALLGTNKRSLSYKYLAGLAALFIGILSAQSFLIHNTYSLALMIFLPGILLTLAFALNFRFIPMPDSESYQRGIRFILLVILSLILTNLLLGGISVWEGKILSGLWTVGEALNYIPAVTLLFFLRRTGKGRLMVTGNEILFQNCRLTDEFTVVQREILYRLCSDPVIRCGDFADEGTLCPKNRDCKATLCPMYDRIYRQVQDLNKKLSQRNLGRLTPPKNKRDVARLGWTFEPEPGISLTRSKRHSLFVYLKSSPQRPEPEQEGDKARVTFPILLMLGALYLSADAVIQASGEIADMPFLPYPVGGAALFLTELLLYACPFLFIRINRFRLGLLLSLGGISALYGGSLFFLDEYTAFLIFNKHTVFLVILLLKDFCNWENQLHLRNFRSNITPVLFWSVWFFMIAVKLFHSPIPGQYILRFEWDFLSMIVDRILLFSLMIQSVIFYSLPRMKLEIRGGALFMGDRELPNDLTPDNIRLMECFLREKSRKMTCLALLKTLGQAPDEDCAEWCKVSVCKPYKRLYKRMQTIRKYSEAQRAGTFLYSEKEKEGDCPGWTFATGENVYF